MRTMRTVLFEPSYSDPHVRCYVAAGKSDEERDTERFRLKKKIQSGGRVRRRAGFRVVSTEKEDSWRRESQTKSGKMSGFD